MSNVYLKEQIVDNKLHKIGIENPSSHFLTKITKCIKFYKVYCIRRATMCKLEETSLRYIMEDNTFLVLAELENLEYQRELLTIPDKLASLKNRKLSRQSLKSKNKWV